ncbi:MAG: glycosyltransferase family 4 protein [Pseudomonadota bacterium]
MIGGDIRAGLTVRALANRFDAVYVVGAAGPAPATWSEDFAGATYVQLGQRTQDQVFKGYQGHDPFHLGFTADEIDRWRQHLRDARPDVIVAEGIWFGDLLDVAHQVHDAAIVVNMHNIESELYRRFFRLQLRQPLSLLNPRILKEQLLGLGSVRKNEDFHFRQARKILVCSDREAKLLEKRAAGKEIHVVPNTYHRDGPPPKQWVAAEASNRSVVFVGAFTYGPNRGAAKQIIRKIAPMLQKESPELRVHVAGRSTDDYFTRITADSPNVTVSENLPDTDTLYQDALCLIVPLRVGAGTRLKILEAMYRGVPVVSTRLGAEGLNLTHERNALYAHSTREFVAAIQRLHRDRDFAAQIGANGKAFYRERYAADKVMDQIGTLVARAAAGSSAELPEALERGQVAMEPVGGHRVGSV